MSPSIIVLLAIVVTGNAQNPEVNFELFPQDGFYNNLEQPEWGAAGSRLLRTGGRAAYRDGVYAMGGENRPSPLEISQRVHSGPSGLSSAYGRNALLVFYSQLVADEILSSGQPGCPPEYENLELPADHPLANSTRRPMVFQRSVYDQSTGYSPSMPRQQTNGVTSYIDGGVIYGTSRVRTNSLRAFKDGRLKGTSTVEKTDFPQLNTARLPLSNQPVPRDHTVKPSTRLLAIGNDKGHETPFLLALQTVWHRYHNSVAAGIKGAKPQLNDEQIFNLARKKVVAVFQNIVMNEWLPAFLNGSKSNSSQVLPPYTAGGGFTGYKPEVRPDISHEFRTALNWRYTITPAAVWTLRDDGNGRLVSVTTSGRGPNNELRNVTSVRSCNQYWDSQDLVKDSLDDIVLGTVLTAAEREDAIVVPDLRAFYYGPFEYSRLDAVAMEIQRDRDHGVGDVNSVLGSYDLPLVSEWGDLGPRAQALRSLYDNDSVRPDDVDLLTAGLLASDVTGLHSQGLPHLFRDIIVRQFARIRDGDRFWFENRKNGLWSQAEVEEIRKTTFTHVLQLTTRLPARLSQVFTCPADHCRAAPNTEREDDVSLDVCSPLQTHDYFQGSQVSFALSFLALASVLPGSVLVLVLVARRRRRYQHRKMTVQAARYSQRHPNIHTGWEWLGPRSGLRHVTVKLVLRRKKVVVKDGRGKELRYIDLRHQEGCRVRTCPRPALLVALALHGEVDLILQLADTESYERFLTALRTFLDTLGLSVRTQTMIEAELKSSSLNRDDRQAVLDEFFRVACVEATSGEMGANDLGPSHLDGVIGVRLSRTEFAEAMGMQPSSIFVRNVFLMADKDNDGFISFHEFLGLFAVLLRGSAKDKARLMFNVYDVHRRGVLTREDFTKMIQSLLELSENAGDLRDATAVERLVSVMFWQAGLRDDDHMTFQHFQAVFASRDYAATLQAATLEGTGAALAADSTSSKSRDINHRKTRFLNSYRKKKSQDAPTTENGPTDFNRRRHNRRSQVRASVLTPSPSQSAARQSGPLYRASKVVEVYYLQIFWAVLYTLLVCGIFIERAYFYAKGREHAGLRRLSGAWTTAMIRGSASVIMFTYASLLLTMCRNTITKLRETFLHRFVPFDSAVAFHKYISVLAMLATIVHVVGHGTNLYCMCTQSTTSINCFFRDYFTPSDRTATFHYWAFQTITGLTGVLVTALIFVLYVFAVQWARRHVFAAFWLTHSLYPLVYLLTFLHGLGRLVQDPLFAWYLLGPLLLFVLDRLASVSRNRIEIPVLRAELLPSDVIQLVFRRPADFAYRSGQWVRIACLKLGGQEYHPFTLTSAPHERHLSLHIRAVGPWTGNLKQAYDRTLLGADPYPTLYLDGPFGEGHQDWYSCQVAVLVGGGIGVTPFASILKDIAFRSRTAAPIACKKVYFLWVTRTQRSFEWMTEVIRQAEDMDSLGVVQAHIFITQFKQKFDLRTTMLYICEQHFQKVEGRSLFTGLRATTHFGRPDFTEFLFSLQLEHPEVRQFGVFSCGPGTMTSSVQQACTTLNKTEGYTYTHHYENF